MKGPAVHAPRSLRHAINAAASRPAPVRPGSGTDTGLVAARSIAAADADSPPPTPGDSVDPRPKTSEPRIVPEPPSVWPDDSV